MIKKYIYLYIFTFSLLHATGAWMINGRPHPELKWETIVTKNFDVHYHEKIFDIALKGASIAEQIRPTLMKQMGIKKLKRLDIVFTSEDEILNGFAMPSNNTIIWVDQNDAALWAGDEKWLRTVIAHELQHLVFFNAINTWLPEPMNSFYSNNPGWIVEGLAEYFTEKWRPFRFDISHKKHLIENKLHKIQDPHNDGFSKSLELNGTGYRASVSNSQLKLQLGYSHDIDYEIPKNIKVVCPKPNIINISSSNKELLGAFAAKIRSFRKPEPFKGKGIKYKNEYIFRKEGKKK